MPKGGARVNSGPLPDPNALRRDRPSDRDGWTLLPASGRSGRPPNWPLGPLADQEKADYGRELEVWKKIWRTSQAVAWERLGWTHDVAVYVRCLVLGERSGDYKLLGEARQWSDRLGLNPAAMARNRWRISADEVGEKRAAAPPGRTSSRDRFKVVSGGDGGA